jgi:hypothetical protein
MPTASTSLDLGADPTGDAVMLSGEAAPAYLDAVLGEITVGSDGALSFVETLAGPVPSEPALPEGDAALGWSFCIDTDPSSAPAGFPLATAANPCEFIVHTRWEGAKLFGLLIDRRPLLEDRSARKLPFDPVLEGDAIRMTVPAASLDDPTAFEWSMFTEELGPFGTDIGYHVDEVPEWGTDVPIPWSHG